MTSRRSRFAEQGLKAALAAGGVRVASDTQAEFEHSEAVLVVANEALATADVAEPGIAGGTTADYWRGDKTWQPLDKAAVGLGSADNTADVAKAVLSATKLATARTLAAAGDVAWSGSFDGSANFSVTATIQAGAVTLAKMANVATATIFYRKTAGTGAPEVQTIATLKTDLGLTGTNSGDQTITLTGDATGSGTGSFIVTLATVNATTGTFGSATKSLTIITNGKGLITSIAEQTVTPAVGSITGLGTGVATALAVNVGSAGAFVTFNGAAGTPSSLTLTNATGLPIAGLVASTVTAIGVGSIELGHASDTTLTRVSAGVVAIEGSNILVSGGALGTPSSGTLTNCTFPTLNQNTTGSAASLTTSRNIDGQPFNGTADITIIAPGTHAATSKVTPVDPDELAIVDSAASNVLKKLTWANLKATLKTYFDTLYQPLAAALTSWAAVVRAAGFDTFAATPTSANLRALVTDETGTGALVFAANPTMTGTLNADKVVAASGLRATGFDFSGTAGLGGELLASGGAVNLNSYNRTSSAFAPLNIQASAINLNPGGTNALSINGALGNYANDAAAATGGVPVLGMYRNGSILMVRVV